MLARFTSKMDGWIDGRIYRLYSHFTFTLISFYAKNRNGAALNPKDKELLSAFVHKYMLDVSVPYKYVAFNII